MGLGQRVYVASTMCLCLRTLAEPQLPQVLRKIKLQWSNTMALSAKKLQEVMKEKRRRDKLPPRPVVVEPLSLTLKPRELSKITERCSNVLLAIESTLVQSARELPLVDDLVVKQALTSLIRLEATTEEPITSVVSQLVAKRATLQVSDEDWSTSLRAICTSVVQHSKSNAGSFSYLTHARAFLIKARSL